MPWPETRSPCFFRFHYTTPVAFANITDDNRKEAELWASIVEKDALFGEGVYASERPPDVFRSRKYILLNNYLTQMDEVPTILETWLDRAAYCIPLIVDRAVAFNVAKQKTPQMPAVTGGRLRDPFATTVDVLALRCLGASKRLLRFLVECIFALNTGLLSAR